MDFKRVFEEKNLDFQKIEALVSLALQEDMPGRDVTSEATIADDQISQMNLVARKAGIVAGLDIAAYIFQIVSKERAKIEYFVKDGDEVSPGKTLISITGNTKALLQAERPALNFLGHLSGIATLTHSWVQKIAGTNTKIRDTRKTTPGMRELEKYAVRCGGGVNHRMNLSDRALVKDNHIAAAGSISEAKKRIVGEHPNVSIEIEVDTLSQLDEALTSGFDTILLDNFSIQDTKRAVETTAGQAKLESSGGITGENVLEYAKTGVDYIAIGALTHSAPILDIGADLKGN
jgi:nicotinate-nucleotide pyrophosphorylase (carboxylating)